MWKKKSCLSLIFGRWSGLCCEEGWRGDFEAEGHTYTLLSTLKSPPISLHLPLNVHRLKALSWVEPVIKSRISAVGGGSRPSDLLGQLQLESSYVSLCLCLTVSFSVLTAAADLSFPRGALWKERNVMLLLRHKSWWSLSALWWPCCSPPPTHTHTPIHTPNTTHPPSSSSYFAWAEETPGARRGVTAVSGMLGGCCKPLPRASPAPETEWRRH